MAYPSVTMLFSRALCLLTYASFICRKGKQDDVHTSQGDEASKREKRARRFQSTETIEDEATRQAHEEQAREQAKVSGQWW
jgi:hypothetical protein